MDIKGKTFTDFKKPEQTAINRLLSLPDNLLQDELNGLEKRITESYNKATRTIRPVRLLLSVDSFILLQGANKLEFRNDGERPRYKGLVCHPSVFPDTDINPYQFIILG
jgi:hypothetical protein